MTTNNASRSFSKFINQKLLDREFCREYINAALEESGEVTSEEFLATLITCLRDIVYAHGGVDKFLEKFTLDVNRQTIYNMFKYSETPVKRGPEFITVYKILQACGADLRVA